METEKGDDAVAQGEPFNYDDILEHLGQIGKFQLRTFLWLCLPAIFPGFITMSLSFTGGVPDYRCYIDGCDDTSDDGLTFLTPWLNNTIPVGCDSYSNSRLMRQCYYYNHTWTSIDECLNGTSVVCSEVQQCDKWVYDTSVFGSTIVTDFELTCDNEWKQPLPSTVYMAGNIFGPFLFGFIADRYGRKVAFIVGVVGLACVGTGSAFSMGVVAFSVLRFFSGLCNIGLFEIYIVWGVEAVGKNYRVTCGFIYQLLFTVGSALLGLIAYYVRDWRILQIIISAPIFILIAYYWIVPESIRWLVVKKRYGEARRLILKAAKVNGKSVPDHLLVIPVNSNDQQNPVEQPNQVEKDTNGTNSSSESAIIHSAEEKENLVDLLRSAILFRRLFIMITAWFAAVMGYYGITFAANNLSGNFYINYELTMLVELPAYVCGIYITDKLGRRPSLSGGLIISGLACLITGLVPEDPAVIRVAFSLIGKFFISAVIATLYSFTVELFPTKTRGNSIGICSTLGHIGGVLAPLLADWGKKIDPALPYIIFSVVNIVVGVLCLLLPETNHIPLPNTIQEAVDMEKYTLRPCCRKKR